MTDGRTHYYGDDCQPPHRPTVDEMVGAAPGITRADGTAEAVADERERVIRVAVAGFRAGMTAVALGRRSKREQEIGGPLTEIETTFVENAVSQFETYLRSELARPASDPPGHLAPLDTAARRRTLRA